LTRKKRKRNIILALEATSIVGRKVATVITIPPVKRRATKGVRRLVCSREKNAGSIRSLPRAYEARVAE